MLAELNEQDQLIAGLEGDINLLQAKLDAAREEIKELKEGWEELYNYVRIYSQGLVNGDQ